ncbi:MAG TPA: ABC transporter ATP-binding protein [Nitrososphaera sp.]|jgi:peptide/nickel transport system ATP-binding protein
MQEKASPKLSVSGLKAHYFTDGGTLRAVDGVNFQILGNESLGIVGESACGKSTLGASLMRSLQFPGRIVEGSMMLDNRDLSKMPAKEFDSSIRWKRIAMVFQGAMNVLDPVYTVGSQLSEILHEHEFQGNISRKISESLRSVGLDDSVAKRYPHELSGGMKQRVVIAMALLMDPELLIADEPTTALDVLVQSQIIDLLKKLRQEKGISVILITHDLAIVSQIADSIAIMYAGKLVELGSAEEVYKDPKHPYTQALIAAIPKLRSSEKEIHFVAGRPPSLINPPEGCRFYDRCPHAMDICRKDPPAFERKTGYVHCWLYEKKSET